MERTILHCDCNSFFASVEAKLNPQLNNHAFAVCGNPEYRHGIVLAKNDRAKKLGVQTGEAIWQAKSKCPSLVTVLPTYGAYEEFSDRIFNIYCRYTDLVEPFGIDECWLDVSGTLHFFGSGKELADEIRATVKKEVGVTLSAGVSFNKIFAKMGSDYKKPDATTVITRDNYRQLLYPLPVTDMFFVGRNTASHLQRLGVFTIGDAAALDAAVLECELGKFGAELYRNLHGLDISAVKPSTYIHVNKSVGNGITFKHDLTTDGEVRTCVYLLSDKVAGRLRRHNAECTVLQVTLKDTRLKCAVHQRKLMRPTQLSGDIAAAALGLIDEMKDDNTFPVRAITVTGQQLVPERSVYEQISFFDLDACIKREKRESLEQVKDALRDKFGGRSLVQCSLINNDLGL